MAVNEAATVMRSFFMIVYGKIVSDTFLRTSVIGYSFMSFRLMSRLFI